MSDLIERLERAATLMPDTWVNDPDTKECIDIDVSMKEAAAQMHKDAARIKGLEQQLEHDKIVFSGYATRIKELEDDLKLMDEIAVKHATLKHEARTERDAIEAATIERCIAKLEELTGRTRGPIIREAIEAIRALKPPVETAANRNT